MTATITSGHVAGVVTDSTEQFPFHAVTKEECYKYLQVGNDSDDSEIESFSSAYERWGLTTAQAKERLDKYGPNELSMTTKKTIWQRIWYQIANILVAILLFVAVVSSAQAIRFATMEPPDKENVITHSIQVVLLVSLIMYVVYLNPIFSFMHTSDWHILKQLYYIATFTLFELFNDTCPASTRLLVCTRKVLQKRPRMR